MKNRILLAVLTVTLVLVMFAPGEARARGHDGFYVGGGLLTIPQFSFDNRLTVPGGTSDRITMLPGIGAWFLLGYDFPGSMWGLQMPIEYQYFRLNGQEWTSSIGSTLEAVLRIAQWANGLEFHLLGGVGWTYFFEGQIGNQSGNAGISAEIGPGFSWFFKRDDTRASLTLDVPFRYIYFLGDHLSASGTSVVAFPVRLGFTVAF